MKNLQTQECNTKVLRMKPQQFENVIQFPSNKVSKGVSKKTTEVLEGAKMMGELPAMNEVEKAEHLARINTERTGANECVLLVLKLGNEAKNAPQTATEELYAIVKNILN